MKKILSLLLAMATTLSLAACGGSPAQDPPSGKDPADDTQQTEETSWKMPNITMMGSRERAISCR